MHDARPYLQASNQVCLGGCTGCRWVGVGASIHHPVTGGGPCPQRTPGCRTATVPRNRRTRGDRHQPHTTRWAQPPASQPASHPPHAAARRWHVAQRPALPTLGMLHCSTAHNPQPLSPQGGTAQAVPQPSPHTAATAAPVSPPHTGHCPHSCRASLPAPLRTLCTCPLPHTCSSWVAAAACSLDSSMCHAPPPSR